VYGGNREKRKAFESGRMAEKLEIFSCGLVQTRHPELRINQEFTERVFSVGLDEAQGDI